MLKVLGMVVVLVLSGCAVVPPSGPVVDIDAVQDLRLQKALYAYERALNKGIAQHIAGFRGYPAYAIAHELSGEVDVTVEIRGRSTIRAEVTAVRGHAVFADWAKQAVEQAFYHRVYLDDELENTPFKLTTTVVYRL